ncbi:MAG: hypothetical protein LC789_14590 [Actinobacteria bacterium]|nr:hypothetical protein [Actinomycetota bacterium]MCA1721334.1 hypothetical protein [Actinomycetota bacterium]
MSNETPQPTEPADPARLPGAGLEGAPGRRAPDPEGAGLPPDAADASLPREFADFEQIREANDRLMDGVRRCLESGWQRARSQILNASRISADDEMFMIAHPEHMGDPAHRIDRWLHQWTSRMLERVVTDVQIFGEEQKPVAALFDVHHFNRIGYLDALDGSRQAFCLPGGWSINFVLQRYLGLGPDRLPKCELVLLAVVDAEGVSALWTRGNGAVELGLVGASTEARTVYSDQLLVAEGEDFGVTGQLTVLAGGYKPTWWEDFSALREGLPDVPIFNTAGGPVARKVIQNSDVVVVQLTASTLWDGIAAGLIAAAGGFVVEVGGREPLPAEHVLAWFSLFGYERGDTTGGALTESRCVPPFVAGMDEENVKRVAAVAAWSARFVRGDLEAEAEEDEPPAA